MVVVVAVVVAVFVVVAAVVWPVFCVWLHTCKIYTDIKFLRLRLQVIGTEGFSRLCVSYLITEYAVPPDARSSAVY